MHRYVLAALVLLAACDTKATASDPTGGGARNEQKSREYESCGASLHCQDNLRCFDHTCRRTTRSSVGDYWAAVGVAARQRGDNEAAIAAYAHAINQYEAEKVVGGVPAEIDCAYGAALAAAKAKKENAELGARVLHRCVLAVPVGSSLRQAAFAQLATLADSGLDPLLLGADKIADLYLTKGPTRPANDKLVVTVSATPEPKKSFAAITEKLTGTDVRGALLACWDANFVATKKLSLSVTLGVRSYYVASEYEDVSGSFVTKVEAPTSADAVEACIREVVEPALKSTRMTDTFNSKLTIAIK